MKKLIVLACLTFALAAFAAPAVAQSYVLAIHGLNSTGPDGFEMKGYAEAKGDSLAGMSVTLELFPTIDTSDFFVNNTDFNLKMTVAVKDGDYQNFERVFIDFASVVNYLAASGGVFGLGDAENVTFANDIVVNGENWTVFTSLSKSMDGGAHYVMTSSLSPAASTPIPSAVLLLAPGLLGLAALKKRAS